MTTYYEIIELNFFFHHVLKNNLDMYQLTIHLFERFLSLKLIVLNTVGKYRRGVTRKSRPHVATGVFKTSAFRLARCFPEIVDC